MANGRKKSLEVVERNCKQSGTFDSGDENVLAKYYLRTV